MREPMLPEVVGLLEEPILDRLLELLPEDLELIGPPREGLVLMTRREGLGTRFHLGEVLASQSRVRYRGCEGWATTMGGDPRRALVAAAIEAMDKFRPKPGCLPEIMGFIEAQRDEIVRKRALEASLTASTRVEFDLLPGA